MCELCCSNVPSKTTTTNSGNTNTWVTINSLQIYTWVRNIFIKDFVPEKHGIYYVGNPKFTNDISPPLRDIMNQYGLMGLYKLNENNPINIYPTSY